MTFSVDDLVSSLNASHIGQEATDLAALQAQLAATLFPSTTTRGRSLSSRAPTTPLARTPSNSISMGSCNGGGVGPGGSMNVSEMSMYMRTTTSGAGTGRRASQTHQDPHYHYHNHGTRNDNNSMPVSPLHHQHNYHHYHHYHPTPPDTVEEEERMVEDLLLTSSSSPYYETLPSPLTPNNHFNHNHQTVPSSSASTSFSPSSFTTTDPFYLSQLQASQQPFLPNPSTMQSPFAQNGGIPQNSPFALVQTAFQVSY